MTDRYQLTEAILALVDSTPLSNIDIAPLLAKYSTGLSLEEQRRLRVTIMSILRELKQNGEIEYYEGNFMITASQGSVFLGNGGLIRSTYKRQKENEKNMPKITPSKIQLATRRNIIDAFSITRISWHGELDQPTFLGRLYDLSKLPSYDSRYNTAGEDIHKHTVMNNDWPDEWVFTDDRFNILHSSDNEFLEFLCMTLHPAVRKNDDELTTLLEIYTNNLKRDGFTLEKTSEIASRPIYSPIQLSSSSPTTTTTTTTTTPSPPTPGKAEVRKALVIGCNTYDHTSSLANPSNDANAMELKLQSLQFEVMKKVNPTQKELKIIIDEFGDTLKGSDVGLFYFAGHGVQIRGLNYLIPKDANLTSEKMVELDCVEANRVLVHMEDAKTSVNLVILDACRDNPFERSWGRGVGLRGLATMYAPKGSLVAYSTAPGFTASDGTGFNGLYTEALLNHISGKDTPVNTMFQKVRLEVMEKSKEAQIPWESTSLTADFYFNK